MSLQRFSFHIQKNAIYFELPRIASQICSICIMTNKSRCYANSSYYETYHVIVAEEISAEIKMSLKALLLLLFFSVASVKKILQENNFLK